MRRAVISSKGRVTIPAELRNKLELNPGTRVDWSKQDGRLVLTAAVTAAKSAKPAGTRRKKPLATDH
jgi:AbrB family looped-hinge helix DNA binding protein